MAISKVQPMRPALDDVIDVLNMGSPDYPPVAHNGEAAKTYYLDPDNGSDSNDGSTTELAVASFERCLELSNEENRNNITIRIVSGASEVVIGALSIVGMNLSIVYSSGTKITSNQVIQLFNSVLTISGTGSSTTPDITLTNININNSFFFVYRSHIQVTYFNVINNSTAFLNQTNLTVTQFTVTNSRFSIQTGNLTLADSNLIASTPSIIITSALIYISITSLTSTRTTGRLISVLGSFITIILSAITSNAPMFAGLTYSLINMGAATYTAIQNAFATPFTGVGIVKHTDTITEL